MYTKSSILFTVDHKKRMHLFSVFKKKFDKGQDINVYLKGLINAHLLSNLTHEELPKLYEIQNLRNKTLDFESVLFKKKWFSFFATGIVNEVLFQHFPQISVNKKINPKNLILSATGISYNSYVNLRF